VSTDPAEQQGAPTAASGGAAGAPSEEELRAAYEAELLRITPAEVMLQSAVSLLNIAARRLGLTGAPGGSEPGGDAPGGGAEGTKDLDQVRDAIDGVRALLDILERSAPQELRPLRDALSQLQIAYARETQASEAAGPAAQEAAPAGGEKAPPAEPEPGAPGPAQSSGRPWVPGS
jgi:hypothetical protein